MSKKWIIVGISGCTNSGKTTLSTFLKNFFPGCVIINQDKYFRPDDSEEHIVVPELNHKNWERLEAVDWENLMKFMGQILNTSPVSNQSLLIVEGHIIFNYPVLEPLFHKKYFLTLNKEECYRRRTTRVYDPPDIPGYFEKVVWPMYLSNLEKIRTQCTNIIFLDGSDSKENIRDTVMHDLKQFIEKI